MQYKIPNQEQLETARNINGFAYKSLSDISESIDETPLSVRVRVAESIHEFVTGVLFGSGFWKDPEECQEDWNRLLSAVVGAMVPELDGSPAALRDALSDEGLDIIRGYKIDLRGLFSEVA